MADSRQKAPIQTKYRTLSTLSIALYSLMFSNSSKVCQLSDGLINIQSITIAKFDCIKWAQRGKEERERESLLNVSAILRQNLKQYIHHLLLAR